VSITLLVINCRMLAAIPSVVEGMSLVGEG